MTAPTREQFEREQAEEHEAEQRATSAASSAAAAAPQRRIVGSGPRPGPVALSDSGLPRDVLIVVSKLKAYIRARSGMNTSDGAMDVLSDIVRELCDGAIQKAAADGRKTVLDRDF